jgi:acyl-CoA synthetase (AMP-forming)/AMP-acid ligase II
MPIGMLLEMAAQAGDDRVAIGSSAGGLSYSALLDAARSGADRIMRTGSQSVAFVDRNGADYIVAFMAAALAGTPFCPLNYRLAMPQIREQIDQLARPLVIVGDDYADAGRGCHANVVASSGNWRGGSPRGKGDPALPHVDDDSEAVLLFTSGTTARPKAVVLRHRHLVNYVLQTVEFGAADPGEAALVSVPPYHVAAIGSALTNIYAIRRMFHLPDFSAEHWLAAVSAERITHAMVVPTMLSRVVGRLRASTADLPSLRHVAYGGARMPAPVLEAALTLLPNVDFVNAYGLTETSSTIALLSPEDHRAAVWCHDPAVRRRLSSVGRLAPGIEAQIRDADGASLPVGEAGELFVRGAQVSGEYRNLPASLDAEGWFATRDIARFDAEGFLFIEGRTDDIIIRGGENIAPAEIEDVLIRHSGVADAAVVGMPDDEWGERVVAAIVVTGPSPSAADIREYVRSSLRGSRTPDDVIFVDALPYTTTGKLLRTELRAAIRHHSG